MRLNTFWSHFIYSNTLYIIVYNYIYIIIDILYIHKNKLYSRNHQNKVNGRPIYPVIAVVQYYMIVLILCICIY